MNDPLQLTLDDLEQHILRFGFEFFPAIDLANEQVRAQGLYRSLNETWPTLFARLSLSARDMVVSAPLPVGAAMGDLPTLTLSARGPALILPCIVHGVRVLDLDDAGCIAHAESIFAVIAAAFPGRRLFRLRVVREVILGTGQQAPDPILVPLADELGGARLVNGEARLAFEDQDFHMRLTMFPLRAKALDQGAGLMRERVISFAVEAHLKTFNVHRRPMTAEDRAAVYARAQSLWPRVLLEYLNKRMAVEM